MILLGFAIALGLSMPPMGAAPVPRRHVMAQPITVSPMARPTPNGQPLVSPAAPPLAQPPAPLPAQCGPAGCTLPDGRHATPAGNNIYTDPSGRQCAQSGAFLNCR